MKRFNATELIAFQQRHPVKRDDNKVWKLYYGANTLPWYNNSNYGYCVAEINRLMKAGQNYKRQLFKIK